MEFLTARKRAAGLGSAKAGTHHFWEMTVSSAALVILVPLFLFTFGPMLGRPYEEVTAFYSRPFPAIVAALTLWVGFMHFKGGIQVVIEDYTGGTLRQALLLGTIFLSYAAAVTGIFAIVKIAL